MASDESVRVAGLAVSGGTDEGVRVDEAFGANLRYYREASGWSQVELAQRMRDRGFPFHQATIYKLEDSKRQPKLNEAVALSEVLEVPLEHLISDASSPELGRARRDYMQARRRANEAYVAYRTAERALADALSAQEDAERRWREQIEANDQMVRRDGRLTRVGGPRKAE